MNISNLIKEITPIAVQIKSPFGEFMGPDFDEAMALRTEILRKPLNMEYKVEDIAQEHNSIHLAGFLDDQIGYAAGTIGATGAIAKTTNGGNTWVLTSYQNFTNFLRINHHTNFFRR